MAQISLNSLMGTSGPSYSEAIVAPFRQELVETGFQQLMTPGEVDQALNNQDDKIVLVILNSVCGCSARVGRPGAILSLLNKVVPDSLVTIFAGMEKDAVTHFRQKYLPGLTPSSPNIAVFKNGQLEHILHRYQIERMEAREIADDLATVYNAICTNEQNSATSDKLREFLVNNYQAVPEQLSTD
jgi:putative YphP/YqiW family bacilliredoxin